MPQAVVPELEDLLQQPEKVQQAYSMLCSPTLLTGGPSSVAAGMEALSPAGYWNGLQAGAVIQKLGVSQGTQSQRDKAKQELAAWLAKSICNRGLQDCIPEDIIVYLIIWWAEAPWGYQAPDGGPPLQLLSAWRPSVPTWQWSLTSKGALEIGTTSPEPVSSAAEILQDLLTACFRKASSTTTLSRRQPNEVHPH